ncbi:membrane protein insertion efficiency factor YidD [Frankia sp. AgB32]|uniref:membrane protein insertion efficiency factor YidD n=1 Tax=Frankia sp. AgB32 TaxID=631119 RepID=UPI00200D92A2|nr:membrane protein insertion efficiency factor YidD [Frankia sp. AgB32]MCK9895251.1 membrane protein insertion efficiency factor YidD [Frankia sp. AgB32]
MSAGSILLVVLGAAAVADVVLASRAARRRVPGLARTPAGAVRGPLVWFVGGLVRLYRAAWSSRNAGMCRFEPSCSAYALEAVRRHGGVRGGVLALARVLRCQPLSAGGYDPVPGGQPAAPRLGPAADSPMSAGTVAGSAVVREPRGRTSTSLSGCRVGGSARTGIAAPAHRRGFPSPAEGTRAEIVGSGRGPWV